VAQRSTRAASKHRLRPNHVALSCPQHHRRGTRRRGARGRPSTRATPGRSRTLRAPYRAPNLPPRAPTCCGPAPPPATAPNGWVSPDECFRRCRYRRSLLAASDFSEPSVAELLRPSHEHTLVSHKWYACGRVARASGRCCTCIGTFISMNKPVALGRPAGEGVGARFLGADQAAWTCGKWRTGCVHCKAGEAHLMLQVAPEHCASPKSQREAAHESESSKSEGHHQRRTRRQR
jgi:hypothetical protein